jgi:anti-sigma-K factor RskA
MSTVNIDHERLRESTGVYVLGLLDSAERREFEQHLETCAECREEVRSLGGVAGALPMAAPQVDPPPSLRAKVLAATGGQRPSSVVPLPPQRQAVSWVSHAGWLSAAALFVISAGLGLYAWSLGQQIDGLRSRLADAIARLERSEQQVTVASRAASTAEGRLAVLLAPDMRQVDLQGQPVAPRASGRAFWSRSRGLVLTAANLPPLPQGRTYQLWMVTATAPISAGVLSPDPSGDVAQTFATPADIPTPAAIALTIEPEGGLPAPTGEKYLVGMTE